MDSLMKFLKWLLIVALSLGALLVIAVLNADSLGRAYDRWTFEHENPIPDVYIGMPKEDILFQYGEPTTQTNDGIVSIVTYKSGADERAFRFEGNTLVVWVNIKNHDSAPYTTESLLELAGPPFLESHDNEERRRRYTYLTDSQTGITYTYETNKLVYVMAGIVEWRSSGGINSLYSIKGTQVCPGEMCPWTKENGKDVFKQQWEDKTVWDLIDEYDL